MNKQNNDVVAVLNDLIETTKDGERGFHAAATYAKSPDLKTLLAAYAEQCARGVGELQLQVSRLGGKAQTSSSVASSVHRGWMKLKASVSEDDDHALLEECERGEDHAKAQYDKALKQPLPVEIISLIRKHYDGLMKHHDRVKALRDKRTTA